MARQDLVLTIDGGGSAIKATVYSVNTRRPLAVAAREVAPTCSSDGIAEFDTEVWWSKAIGAIRGAVEAAARRPADYLGITCTGMRIPFVLLDRRGEPLGPGVLNFDRRGYAYLREVREALGARDLYRLTGHWANAQLGLPKLLWYRYERPELWRRVRRVLQFHDWLVYRLSGAVVSEPSSAAMSQLIDVERRCWADELLHALDLDRHVFPDLYDAGTLVGGLLPAVGRATGLAAGTPVHVGAGDTHLAVLGSGGTEPGTAAIVGGSTTPIMYASSTTLTEPCDGPFVSPHALAGLWALETNAGATGMLYTWLRDLIGADGYAALDVLADAVPIGARGLCVTGPNPFWGEDAWERVVPMGFIGVTPAHRVGELARGVLEAIAHAVRSNLEALESAVGSDVGKIIFTGGASRSSVSCRLLANVLGRPIVVPTVPEPAAVGAAVLVAGEQARGRPQVVTYEPEEQHSSSYAKQAISYSESYRRIQQGFSV